MVLTWEYRFFEREILPLLRADPDLRASYGTVYQRRLAEWQGFVEELVSQRLMRPPRPPRTVGDLTIAIWLIAQGWLPFLDVTGDPEDPEQVTKGTDLLLVALDPHMTAEGRRRFAGAKEHERWIHHDESADGDSSEHSA
jgi:hypothetical protein